jgi:hypothetical protein
MTEIAKEIELNGIEFGDMNELIDSHGEEISMDDLEGLAEQVSKEYTEDKEANSAMQIRKLTVRPVQEATALINK